MNNKEEILAAVTKTVGEGFNDFMEKRLVPTMEEISVKTARQIVEQAMVERAIKGRDISGLTGDQKVEFAKQVQAVFRGHRDGALKVKANEALIEEQDNRGGYLVQPEIAAAILRIAASVGTIMKQCQNWPMKTDELGIPNYTGSFLTGSYVGVDLPGPITGLTFGQAVLIARKWQLAFTVGNDLLTDASVQLADWLMAMAGEALANMIDQQGFIGGSTSAPGPFVGIMEVANTNTYTLPTGGTSYNKFDPVKDASNVIAQLEESILDGAAWYFHRTSWAAIRQNEASSSGIPLLFLSGAADNLRDEPGGGPIKPAGRMGGYPVYTNRWLPQYVAGATNASTAFGIFGNMKACAFGDKGDLRVAQFQSGNFGTSGQSKEIALSDQTGIVYKHRHAFVVVLPKAFCIISTSAS